MADRVGLTRNFNLAWLNAAADCQLAGMTKAEAREHLEPIIAQTLQSKDNIRKTRTMLLNLWYDNHPWIQATAIDACRTVSMAERRPLHWALLLAQYPVFFDLCTAMGSLFDYRPAISLQQIKARVFEKWGARTTLGHSLKMNVMSLRDIDVIRPAVAIGSYTAEHYVVDDKRIVYALADAILENENREYMMWEEIIHHPALYPFEIQHVTQADIASCDHFSLERMGDDVVIRIHE